MKNLAPVILFIISISIGFSQNKPDIVIFISDDQSQIDAGCYGNRDVRTPNMDKLAGEGMKFTRAYAATSMCTPSRSAMYTGLYPFRNGSQLNHYPIKPGTRTLPHYLKDLGYRVVLAGKTHINPESAFPFEYIVPDMARYTPISGRGDSKGETVKFINEYFANKGERKPLCLIVATWWPHVPWMQHKDFDPEKLRLPDYLVDTKETRIALANYYQSIVEADNLLGRVMDAVDDAGKKDNTVFMYFSDQGVQFPGAKWTVYDQGLRVPLIVRWPQKVQAGSASDALVTLTDLTPTLIDLAGGKPAKDLDGKSFADVFLGKKKDHHDYIFAETSVEPHYWYNYTPARTIITKEGLHYIRNYNPGVRFITHIDAFQQNNSYFSTWVAKSQKDEKAAFLVNRYSYRPPEELFDLKKDPWEFNNLVVETSVNNLPLLQKTMDKELARQGETSDMIIHGQFPDFYHNAYEIKQGVACHPMSFDKSIWEPETLFVTGYIDGLNKPGVLLKYFEQFTLTVKDNQITIHFRDGRALVSGILPDTRGHMLLCMSAQGDFEVKINGKPAVRGKAPANSTRINGGYVSVGHVRDGEPPAGLPVYFPGKINKMRFTMNNLEGAH